MVLYEVLGECPIEAFDRAVHLGTARVGMVVDDIELGARVMEKVRELRSVVSLDLCDIEWSNRDELREEISGRFR